MRCPNKSNTFACWAAESVARMAKLVFHILAVIFLIVSIESAQEQLRGRAEENVSANEEQWIMSSLRHAQSHSQVSFQQLDEEQARILARKKGGGKPKPSGFKKQSLGLNWKKDQRPRNKRGQDGIKKITSAKKTIPKKKKRTSPQAALASKYNQKNAAKKGGGKKKKKRGAGIKARFKKLGAKIKNTGKTLKQALRRKKAAQAKAKKKGGKRKRPGGPRPKSTKKVTNTDNTSNKTYSQPKTEVDTDSASPEPQNPLKEPEMIPALPQSQQTIPALPQTEPDTEPGSQGQQQETLTAQVPQPAPTPAVVETPEPVPLSQAVEAEGSPVAWSPSSPIAPFAPAWTPSLLEA